MRMVGKVVRGDGNKCCCDEKDDESLCGMTVSRYCRG